MWSGGQSLSEGNDVKSRQVSFADVDRGSVMTMSVPKGAEAVAGNGRGPARRLGAVGAPGVCFGGSMGVTSRVGVAV